MAKNTGEGYRIGAQRERVQKQVPGTGVWVKYDTNTGGIVGVKKDPWKGVAKKS